MSESRKYCGTFVMCPRFYSSFFNHSHGGCNRQKFVTKKTSVESQLSLSKNTEYKATNPNYGTPDQPERWSWLKQHRSRERGSETTPFCSEKIKLGKLVRQQWQPLCEL